MRYDCLLYETKDRVATLTLNRPERLNALGGTLREDLTAAMQHAICSETEDAREGIAAFVEKRDPTFSGR